MSASDWAAWVGAISGGLALIWEIVRWSREGPRLIVNTVAHMQLTGGDLLPKEQEQLRVGFFVANAGTRATTLTGVSLFELHRRPLPLVALRPSRSFYLMNPGISRRLPLKLEPGERWEGAVIHNDEIVAMIEAETLYVGVHHALAARPTLVSVRRG